MVVWDPAQYLHFSDHRLRPALDLLARIGHPAPRLVHDVGCGPGNVTRVIADRWPEARIIGSDISEPMLDVARNSYPELEWQTIDVRSWDPPEAPDVIYSNAVLHWIPHHDETIRTLFRSLAPQGVLAIQMPLSSYEPSRKLMAQTLDDLGLLPDLRRKLDEPDVAPVDHYVDLGLELTPQTDVWTTTYRHCLSGPDPVFEWFNGSALRSVRQALPDADRERYDRAYKTALRTAYPMRPDGTTILPFPRLFMVLTNS